MIRRTLCISVLLCVVCLLSSCASPAMKGTPFFTGDYKKGEGEVEDRVNLWPLLYYRKPALSILWPVGEFSDEHVAVRPLFSIHGLDKKHRKVNVLWPLSSFDAGKRSYHIFPAFWGSPKGKKPYFVLFPFVWHKQEKHSAFFPFFLRYVVPGGSSVHALWPIFHRKTGKGERGWRVWPLYGQYRDEKAKESHRYVLWPLLMSIRDGSHLVRLALPFYVGWRKPDLAMDLLLPVLYRLRSDDRSDFALFPLFYRSRDKEGNWTFVSPIYSGQREADSLWDLVLPLYFRSRTPESRTTLMLPAYYARESGKEKQSLLFPLFYKWTDGDASMLLTLPVGLKKSGERRTIYAFPLLSAYSTAPEGKDLWALFPLSHWRWKDGVQASHVFPLYYWDRDDGLFLSLPFSARSKGKDRFVNVLGPLAHYAWEPETLGTWSFNLLWPFAKISRGSDKLEHRILPLWNYSRTGERKRLNLGLLLADYEAGPDGKEWSALGPLVGGKATEKESEHHVWPLYSYERDQQRKRLKLGPYLGDLYLFGRKWSERRSFWVAFPFFHYRSTDSKSWREESRKYKMDVAKRGFTAFPFVSYNRSEPLIDTKEPVPEKPLKEGKRPVGSKKSRPKPSASLFVLPLFGYSRDGEPDKEAGEGKKNFWLLGWLYDYNKKVEARKDAPEEREVYVRRRILWRLMHYERRNDSSSLDIFPGITYDKKGDEKKTFSFLWRVFRYERQEGKGTKVHVLFIPVKGWDEPPAEEPAAPQAQPAPAAAEAG